LGLSGAEPVFHDGRWWTVLTAGWLHGNIVHIGFNMMSIRNIAPVVADFYGASRMAIIYIVSSAVGFTVSSLLGEYGLPIWPLYGASYTLGASAGITGLIGAILFYSRRTGSRHIDSWAKSSIIGFLLMGLVLPLIDNWAHIGGLAGGYFCSKILDPLHPERIDHLLIAIGLLIVTFIALVASVLHALRFI
jgi:rhomboid protease GluP